MILYCRFTTSSRSASMPEKIEVFDWFKIKRTKVFFDVNYDRTAFIAYMNLLVDKWSPYKIFSPSQYMLWEYENI